MHWRNSRFQVLHFIVGKTHTPDEAYRVLLELREERQLAVNNVKVSDLRTQAKIARAQEKVLSPGISTADRLEAEADLAEVEAFRENGQACIDEAYRELDFIDLLIAKIKPHRKYSDMPVHEANQFIQSEEWMFELIRRGENHLMSSGHIPADQLGTMRMHPNWETEIYPHLQKVTLAIQGRKAPTLFATPITPLLGEIKNSPLLLGA